MFKKLEQVQSMEELIAVEAKNRAEIIELAKLAPANI